MILWLDHLIFGNGHGLGSPFFDDRFYWLVDTKRQDRGGENGELYTFMSGLGAQLHSFQWRHPKAGEERRLANRTFRPLHSRREFLWLWRNSVFPIPLPIARVSVAWSWINLPKDIDQANAALREMPKTLGDHIP
ncbi:MAG: hypothetical protein WBH00_04005 [Xanthobacteraceae bacterium]